MGATSYVHDFWRIGYEPTAGCDPHDLDLLAAIIERESLTVADERKVSAWLDDQGKDLTPIEVANIVLRCDEIPYSEYDCPDAPAWASNEEKLGRTLMNLEDEMLSYLRAHDMENFFDFEKYGKECAYEYVLDDWGALNCCAGGPSDDLYDREELEELAEEYLPSSSAIEDRSEPHIPSLKDEAKGAKAASEQLSHESHAGPMRVMEGGVR